GASRNSAAPGELTLRPAPMRARSLSEAREAVRAGGVPARKVSPRLAERRRRCAPRTTDRRPGSAGARPASREALAGRDPRPAAGRFGLGSTRMRWLALLLAVVGCGFRSPAASDASGDDGNNADCTPWSTRGGHVKDVCSTPTKGASWVISGPGGTYNTDTRTYL